MSTDSLSYEPADSTYNKMPLDVRRKLLRKFRKQAALSLRDAAKRAKLSAGMVSRFETGNRDLSAAAYNRLERVILLALERHQKRGVPLSALLHAGPESTRSTEDWLREEIQHLNQLVEIQRKIIRNWKEIDRLKEQQRKEQGPIDPEIEESFRREVASLETEKIGLEEKIAEKESAPKGGD